MRNRIQRLLFDSGERYSELRKKLAIKTFKIFFESALEKHFGKIANSKKRALRLFLEKEPKPEFKSILELVGQLFEDNPPDSETIQNFSVFSTMFRLDDGPISVENNFFKNPEEQNEHHNRALEIHLLKSLHTFYDEQYSEDLDEFLAYMDSMIAYSNSINNNEHADHPIWTEIDNAYSRFAKALDCSLNDNTWSNKDKLRALGVTIYEQENSFIGGCLRYGDVIFAEIQKRLKDIKKNL